MIHRDAGKGSVKIYDLFANAPGLEGTPGPIDFEGIDIYFPEGATTQTFHIGRGAAAVPGTLGGLCAVLAKKGRLPLGEILELGDPVTSFGAIVLAAPVVGWSAVSWLRRTWGQPLAVIGLGKPPRSAGTSSFRARERSAKRPFVS